MIIIIDSKRLIEDRLSCCYKMEYCCDITKHIKCTNKMQATKDHEKQRNSPYSILPPTPHPSPSHPVSGVLAVKQRLIPVRLAVIRVSLGLRTHGTFQTSWVWWGHLREGVRGVEKGGQGGRGEGGQEITQRYIKQTEVKRDHKAHEGPHSWKGQKTHTHTQRYTHNYTTTIYPDRTTTRPQQRHINATTQPQKQRGLQNTTPTHTHTQQTPAQDNTDTSLLSQAYYTIPTK